MSRTRGVHFVYARESAKRKWGLEVVRRRRASAESTQNPQELLASGYMQVSQKLRARAREGLKPKGRAEGSIPAVAQSSWRPFIPVTSVRSNDLREYRCVFQGEY